MKNKIITWLFVLFMTGVLSFVSFGISHTHCGWSFSRQYCPNCYKPTSVRVDLQKVCEECGYNFYLNYNELPDNVK